MPNLSQAWLTAVKKLRCPGNSLHGLVVTVDEFDGDGLPIEEGGFRGRLDAALVARNDPTTTTTAQTIFPFSHSAVVASPNRQTLYDRYERIISEIREYPLNKKGVYFERMIMFPSYDAPPGQRTNQLESLLQFWESKGRRKSAFQVCVFRPEFDWTKQPYGKFPCMQHLVFTPIGDILHVSAFYATQYLLKRAYGNYLGLCRLGAFMAHEMKLRMGSLECYAAHAPLEGSKKNLDDFLREIES